MMELWQMMIMAFALPLLAVLGVVAGFVIVFAIQWIGSAILMWMGK